MLASGKLVLQKILDFGHFSWKPSTKTRQLLTFSDGADGEGASLSVGGLLHRPAVAGRTRFGRFGRIGAENAARLVGVRASPAALQRS